MSRFVVARWEVKWSNWNRHPDKSHKEAVEVSLTKKTRRWFSNEFKADAVSLVINQGMPYPRLLDACAWSAAYW